MKSQKFSFYEYYPLEIGSKITIKEDEKEFIGTVIKCERIMDDWFQSRFEITIELDEPLEVPDTIAFSSRGI